MGFTVKPPINVTLKEQKPPDKGQAKSTSYLHTLKSPLTTKDNLKWLVLNVSLLRDISSF